MSTSSPFAAQPDLPKSDGEIEECRQECLEKTIRAYTASGLATTDEIEKLKVRYAQKISDDQPADLVEILARLQGTEEERMGIEVARISHGIASVINPSPPLIPFAGKLIAPSAFYEAYTQLHELSKALLSPVIFAEDTDAIGTGGLNPVASLIMAERILQAVNRRFAIQPFVTAVRLDYESWNFLGRKHYGL